MAEGGSSRREQLKVEAAAWVIRLSNSDVEEDERAAFERWRDTSPEHEVAYEREAATWSRLDRLQALKPAGSNANADLLAPERLAVNDDEPVRSWTLPSRAAAAIIGIVGLGTLAALGLGFGADPAYATAIGERRLVVLEDGSRVELNTNSEIRVHFHNGRREVELVKGEASFDVATDKRPFLITTTDASFAAGASELTVRLKADGAAIAVQQGSVNALPGEHGSDAKPIQVTAGYGGVFREDGGQPRQITPDEMTRSLAWQQGAIALDGQTLKDAVAEFNRYNVQQIAIADRSIAGYRLGGYFRTDDIRGFVKALQTTFPIKAAKGSDGSVQLAKRANS